MLDGQDLRDHAAHGRADDMRARDPERVQKAKRVVRHVGQRIERFDRQAEHGAPQLGGGRKRSGWHRRGKADIAIIEAYDAKTARR